MGWRRAPLVWWGGGAAAKKPKSGEIFYVSRPRSERLHAQGRTRGRRPRRRSASSASSRYPAREPRPAKASKAQPAAGAGVPKFASVEFEAFDASSARSEEPADPPEPSRPRPPRGRERATSARAFGVHTRLSARTHASAPSGARGAARRGSDGWRRSCRRAPRGRGGARRLGGPRRARRDEDVFEVFRSSALRQISRAVTENLARR